MNIEISTWGALLALAISIILIIRKCQPAYALMFGAFVGGMLSCFDVGFVVAEMVNGAKDITGAILRILTAGVLTGVLIGTRSADKIALSVGNIFGKRGAIYAMVVSTFILTFSGVFIDVAVLTVAPIALVVARENGYSRIITLVALVGGGKSGNVISPNPNTISSASNFDALLSSAMFANIGAALVGIILTFIVVRFMIARSKTGFDLKLSNEEKKSDDNMPSLFAALSGPIVAIGLLILRPLIGVSIDPIIALPVGGFVCAIFSFKFRDFLPYATNGLAKMTPIAVLLLGTGCLGGIIKASALKGAILFYLEKAGVSDIFIAPVSGALMSAATASTTAGAAIASATFSQAVLASGISAIWGAAMTNAGAVMLDQMPHGSFFHVSGGSVRLEFSERLKALPYETIIGGGIAAASTFSCWLFS